MDHNQLKRFCHLRVSRTKITKAAQRGDSKADGSDGSWNSEHTGAIISSRIAVLVPVIFLVSLRLLYLPFVLSASTLSRSLMK